MVTFSVEHERAYSSEATACLQPIQSMVKGLAQRFAAEFFDSLASTVEGSRILSALLEEEAAQLRAREAQYLELIFSPQLTMSQHQTQARRVGRAHALVGVELQTLVESFALFQQEVREEIVPLMPPR